MTPRQQRRLEQKLARKAAKKASKAEVCAEPLPAETEVTDMPIAAAPISEARLAANRSNAQLSHGPVTTAGKEIVSQNATRHGLTGKFRVMPNESQADFDELLKRFLACEQPRDQEEVEFVHQMAEATWLSRRSIRLQDRCILAMESGTPEERKQASKDLSLYLRYMTTHDRAYSRYSTELRKRRNERRKEERGFVSQKLREGAERRREANENRKKELHELRQINANCRRERVEIQNRIAAAKAERLELQNMANRGAKTMAAAA